MSITVGIDVAKDELVVCIVQDHEKPRSRVFSNTTSGHESLVTWVGKIGDLDVCHFCMESTGPYSFGIAAHLATSGLRVSVENPRRVKQFIGAMGLRCKTDKVDAHAIAEFAKAMKPRLWYLTDSTRREIAQLRTRLDQLGKTRRMESNRLENSHLPDLVKTQIQSLIKAISDQEKAVLVRIAELMPRCPQVETVYRAVGGICGIGHKCALRFATEVDVMSFEEGRLVSTFFGVSPKKHESGRFKGQSRISKQGNGPMRSDFYCAARTAVRFNPVLKEFFERLIAKGLKRKQALVAVVRKLLIYCWAIGRRALLHMPITYPGGERRRNQNGSKACEALT